MIANHCCPGKLMLKSKILHSTALRLLASHSRQAKDTKQTNINNLFIGLCRILML
jgi:hypothetical protein